MPIITSKTIFKEIFLTSLEISLISILLIEFIEKYTMNLLNTLIILSTSLYYLEIIFELSMFYYYYKYFNQSTGYGLSLFDWKLQFRSYKIKLFIDFLYTINNIIISGIVIFNRGKDSPKLPLIIFLIIASTVFKFLTLFLLFSLYALSKINYQRPRIVEIETIELIEIKTFITDTCSICLDDTNDKWSELKCGHKFHKNCILSWTNKQRTCPICREQL